MFLPSKPKNVDKYPVVYFRCRQEGCDGVKARKQSIAGKLTRFYCVKCGNVYVVRQ